MIKKLLIQLRCFLFGHTHVAIRGRIQEGRIQDWECKRCGESLSGLYECDAYNYGCMALDPILKKETMYEERLMDQQGAMVFDKIKIGHKLVEEIAPCSHYCPATMYDEWDFPVSGNLIRRLWIKFRTAHV